MENARSPAEAASSGAVPDTAADRSDVTAPTSPPARSAPAEQGGRASSPLVQSKEAPIKAEGGASCIVPSLVAPGSGGNLDGNSNGESTAEEQKTALPTAEPPVLSSLPPDVLLLIMLQLKKLPHPTNFRALQAMACVSSFFNILVKHSSLYSFTVDCEGSGDFLTIAEALEKTRDGDKIVVYPGVYEEHLLVKRAVEIVAKERLRTTITSSQKYVIKSESMRCRVVGFKLIQTGSPACVYVTGTYMEVLDCEITSGLSACVNIGRDAMAILRGNRIHHSQNTGVFAYSGAFGIIENNEIYQNKFPGISVTTKANLIIKNNKIYANKQNGIHVYEKGQAVIENNDIFGNHYPGIAVKNGSNPVIRGNRVFLNKQNGIHIFNSSTAIVSGNRIFENGYSGISIKSLGNPLVSDNIIFGNGEPGIFVLNDGRGIIEENHIFENRQDGVLIKSGGDPLVKNNNIYNNGEDPINRKDGGQGAFLCNVIQDVSSSEDSDDDAVSPRIIKQYCIRDETHSRAALTAEMADLLTDARRLLEECKNYSGGSQGARNADEGGS